MTGEVAVDVQGFDFPHRKIGYIQKNQEPVTGKVALQVDDFDYRHRKRSEIQSDLLTDEVAVQVS